VSAHGIDDGPALPIANEDTIRECEDRAFRAWPAESTHRLTGWVVRSATLSTTRRTNSVFAGPVDDSINLDALFRQVESFYGNMGIPPRFQITPVSSPIDLDARLDDRGYTAEGWSSVAWAQSSDVIIKSGDTIDDVLISPTMTDEWADIYTKSISAADDPKARLALFNRIKCQKAHVTASKDGVPIAIGLGIFDSGWTGVFAMFTLPEFRRQGLAHGIVGALADWTQTLGGDHMYLQVEDSNDVSWSVYERCGFHPEYQYHYRTKLN